ncbi:iron-containing redox enzyme family protein [Streptomyces sp. NPDC048253]|uniref:iron-containing redox enzyme family protein n=2 Tax=Streptomyces TaxID=1883 RepID=UPI00224D0ACB|nr:iron-containing redox enzyme family protein [Streptomyces sp. NBC_00103]MCX5372827.1 iron-containing redox enzyme family protein [Streptomyces sp. NBC_00103]
MTAPSGPPAPAPGVRHAQAPLGAELRTVLALVAPVLHHSAARLWQPQGLRARYLRYLVTMHTVIRASVPLMERARAHCRDAPATDSAARPLGSYLSAHIPRERHHDTWLLRDMEAAGLHPGHELARPPSPEVARLVGAQYYWIDHFHPLCLLGYVAVLELNAPAAPLIPLLADRTGLPPAAFDTLRLHAEIDGGHSTAVLSALDESAAVPPVRAAVRLSALHTVQALADVLNSLTDVTDRTGGPPEREDHRHDTGQR